MVDVVVLTATVIDLQGGGVANWSHGLAATYVGVSVAFGRSMIRWADQRFAYRFAAGPALEQPPKDGPQRVRYEWQQWLMRPTQHVESVLPASTDCPTG